MITIIRNDKFTGTQYTIEQFSKEVKEFHINETWIEKEIFDLVPDEDGLIDYGEPTAEELDAQAKVDWKVSRAELVEAIKVTTLAGNEFDGDETSQTRMSRAIAVMNDTDTIMWILANDEAIMVGKAEMMEALKLASAEQTRLWVL